MLPIKWNNELMSVGIDIIDEQHKKLFEILNEVIFSIENKTQIQDIEGILDKVAAYADYHFKTEEKLLKELKLNKHEMNIHITQHQNFIDKINEFKNKELPITSNNLDSFIDLDKYLCNWLIQHILKEDKEVFNNILN